MVSPPLLNARESENRNLDHVINNCPSGIKIKPEKNYYLLQKFPWKHLAQIWKKIIQSFLSGRQFSKNTAILQSFCTCKNQKFRKRYVFHKFHSSHLHWLHKYHLPGLKWTGMSCSPLTCWPNALMEATTTLGTLISWRLAQPRTVALRASFELRQDRSVMVAPQHPGRDADAHVTLLASLVTVPQALWVNTGKILRVSPLKLPWWRSLSSVQIWLDQSPCTLFERDWMY